MQIESRPLTDLIDRLRVEPRVWLRVAANRPQENWQLSLLEVTLGEAPPGWRRQRWAYERAVFVAAAPAGATVARWLERGRISTRSISLVIPPQDRVQMERRQSRFPGILQPLPWPSIVWTVNVRDESTQMLHDELVADDAPAFLTFDLASAAFSAFRRPRTAVFLAASSSSASRTCVRASTRYVCGQRR